MVIVDSSVWIDALWGTVNAHTAWLQSSIRNEEIGLSSLILYEVLQGIRDPAHFDKTRRYLASYCNFDGMNGKLAVAAAENYRHLRARGITIRKSMDCLIATFCIESGHRLLHRDRDFDAFERHLGLRVVHPAESPLN